MKRNKFLLLAALCLGSLLMEVDPLAAQDWPQWRGPNRDGAAGSVALPQTWPAAPSRSWRVEVGSGQASPLVVGDRIYLHTRLDDREVIASRRLDSGELLWSLENEASYRRNFAALGHGKGPRATPVLDQGRLYTVGITGIVSCVEAATGQLLWRRDFAQDFEKAYPVFGASASPLVAGDLVVVHPGGEEGALLALDAATGKERWRWAGDGPGYTSPIVVELDGVAQLVTQSRQANIGLALDSGQLLWRQPYTTAYDQNIITPVALDSLVIFSGIDNGITAFKLTNADGTWSAAQAWHNEELSLYMSSPVLAGGRLCGFSHFKKGQYFCLDAATGQTLWTGPGRQGDNATLVVADEQVLALSDEAVLTVFDPAAAAFSPLAQYTVADESTWSYPIVLAGGLLIKDEEHLSRWTLE
ncbi:MAG: PQQ-binding-like beta-propeller repeat protein [Candidatus Latescibacteria bacterium]|nr:PQQ-binding-like beta-propeller repeat protein [Candidatus Latescibacterota bacterium]